MLKVDLEDIEVNAAYIELIYEHIQCLDIPNDQAGLVLSSE